MSSSALSASTLSLPRSEPSPKTASRSGRSASEASYATGGVDSADRDAPGFESGGRLFAGRRRRVVRVRGVLA